MNELYSMNPSVQYIYLEVLFLSLTLGIIGANVGWENFLEMIKKVVDKITHL